MIDNGWHMYSHDLDPNAGPTPLQVKWDKLEGVELNGGLTSDKKAHVQFDAMFNAELSWWTESVVISQAFTATAPNFVLTVQSGIRHVMMKIVFLRPKRHSH